MKRYLLASLLLFSYTTVFAVENTLLQQAIDGNHRSAEHKNRDQYRHPLATLNFFQVEPTMTVVEIWPGEAGIRKFWHLSLNKKVHFMQPTSQLIQTFRISAKTCKNLTKKLKLSQKSMAI
jgi:hypothetical protein